MDPWTRHRLIGHRLAALVRRCGCRRLAWWLHDRTLPPHRNHLWDIIGERLEERPRRGHHAKGATDG